MKRKIYKLLSSAKRGLFALALASIPSLGYSQATYTFNYTGAVQTLTLSPGFWGIECWGANGGSITTLGGGGIGGYSKGELQVTSQTTINIFVGGRGNPATGTSASAGAGGWNGGGGGSAIGRSGAGGGGATDVRLNGIAAGDRIIVAGGGGGAAYYGSALVSSSVAPGGNGGGQIGQNGSMVSNTGVVTAGGGGAGANGAAPGVASVATANGTATGGGGGGSSGAAASVGQPGIGGGAGGAAGPSAGGSTGCAGGGGGGYAGGAGGVQTSNGGLAGGGGSGYIGGVTNAITTASGQAGFVPNPVVTGNGLVIITQLSIPCTASIENPTITTTGVINNNGVCLHAGEAANFYIMYAGSGYINVNYNWLASSSPSGPFSPVGTSTLPTYVTPAMGATAVYYMVEATCVSAGVTVPSNVFGTLPNPTVALSSVPNINFASSSLSVCTNDHYTITASGASTYTWNNGAGSSSANPYVLTPMVAFPSYTVIGESAEGCTDTNTMSIATIFDAPIVFLNASSNNICEGSSTFLMVTSDAYVFSWAPNISSVANLIMVTPTSNTEYSVTATSVNGCSQTVSQMINVNPPPVVSVITSTTPGQVPCAKEPINMAASGATTYTWMATGMYAQGPTIVVNPKESSTYYVSGTDQNGCTGTTVFNLVVDACVGITELNANEGVNVYPNPNNGEFVVELNNASAKSVELYDLTGRMVLSNTASDNKVNVNMNHLSNGVYYLKVKSENATKMVKVVKQ